MNKIIVDGREYASVEEMPGDIRQIYEQAMGDERVKAAANLPGVHFAIKVTTHKVAGPGYAPPAPGAQPSMPATAVPPIEAAPRATPLGAPRPIEPTGSKARALIIALVAMLAGGVVLSILIRR